MLFHPVDASEEKAHAHDEKKVGQHTPDQRGLHDENFIIHQGDDGDDQFDGISVMSEIARG